MTADADFCRELGQQLRVDSVRASAAAGSGHPTSSMSAADLIAVLLHGHLRLDFGKPDDVCRDHLIFSKGHASPLYYSMLKAVGAIEDEELLTFRKLHSRLEGHPTPRIPPTDVATGSLGQGLPIGVGIAIAARDLDRLPYRVWVLCGDSEMAEGSIWEAIQHAGWARLDNLIAIIDVNRLGQTRETMLGWDLDGYRDRIAAFGWRVLEIDGHDVSQIDAAYSEAEKGDGRPTAILARTKKGRGVKAVEDQPGWHGKPLPDPDAAIAELGGLRDLRVLPPTPPRDCAVHSFATDSGAQLPRWELGEEVATRQAYGDALTALGSMRGDIVALDGEVSNSTGTGEFITAHPDRYFEMFIAEQQLVAATVGISTRGWIAFASSFAAFFSRAYDFIRMAAISRANIRLVGSHAGVSIGQDGPSQMALEDLASIRAIHGSTVLHPSDANQAAQLVAAMAERKGISYMRTLRGKTKVRTDPEEQITIGGSREVRVHGEGDDLLIIACGITVGEADKAAAQLGAGGDSVRVLDCYSLKPLDVRTVRLFASAARQIVTVEDHWAEGGLGDAVLEALADVADHPPVHKLAVREMPGSGTPEELLHEAGIDAESIVRAVREGAFPKIAAASESRRDAT
jgi:transketolase